jgi:hypothetical protein
MWHLMKPILLIILFSTLTLPKGFSQPVFDNDTSFKPFLTNFVDVLDSTFQLDKNAEFELRFWTLISKTMERRLFILSKKNNMWAARLFKKSYLPKDTLIEILISQTKLDLLWKNLNKGNILEILRGDDLRNKKGTIIDDPIYCGISYLFELMTQKNKRSYWYGCPKSFSKAYKYIKAYKHVVQLITLIYKHCKLKLNIC